MNELSDADPHAEHRLSAFLRKGSYVLLLDAYLVARVVEYSRSGSTRALSVLALVVPVAYTLFFVSRLTPELRRQLLAAIKNEQAMLLATTCELAAVAALIGAATAAGGLRDGLSAVASLLAVTVRILLYARYERTSRATRGQTPRPAIGTGALWVIAVLVALCGAFLIVATFHSKAGALATALGLATLAGAALIGRAAHRRRHQTHGGRELEQPAQADSPQ